MKDAIPVAADEQDAQPATQVGAHNGQPWTNMDEHGRFWIGHDLINCFNPFPENMAMFSIQELLCSEISFTFVHAHPSHVFLNVFCHVRDTIWTYLRQNPESKF